LVQLSQNETVEMISSLADDLEKEKREKEALLVTIESQRLQIDSLQAVTMKVSDRKSAESAKVESLQLELKSFEKQNLKLKSDNQGLLKERDELLDALEAERESRKSQPVQEKNQIDFENFKIAEQDAKIMSLSSELSHAVSSLQQAVTSAKTMKIKADEERSNRITFEKRVRELEFEIQELKTSKELISSTILDSLHKEQEKTTSLERMLQSHVPHQESELSPSLVSRLCDLIDTDGCGHITSSNILYAISNEDSEALKLFQTLGLVPSAVDTAKALEFAKKLFVRYHDGANYGEFFEYLKSYKLSSTSLVITPKNVMMAELEKMRNVYYYILFKL
jgi:chromosome segregation ATPase